MRIKDKGLEKLNELRNLNLGNKDYIDVKNQLTNIDVSKNTKLGTLHLNGNQLTNLDITNNVKLTYLNVSYNIISKIDVSKNVALTSLDVNKNQLTSLDVSKNEELVNLSLEDNKLTKLDVSKNIILKNLYVSSNQLTSIDVSNNKLMEYLYIPGNELVNIDLNNNLELYYLSLANNKLTSLDVSKNTKLKYLYASFNQLTNIDLSNNTKLTDLNLTNCKLVELWVNSSVLGDHYWDFGDNPIKKLKISNSNELTYINLEMNSISSRNKNLSQLEEVILEDIPLLERLTIKGTNLNKLTLNNVPKLKNIDVSDNQFINFDVGGVISLTNLDIHNNKLVSLNINNNPKLKTLIIGNNPITNLSISNNNALTELALGESNKELTTLTLDGVSSLKKLTVTDTNLQNLNLKNLSSLAEIQAYSNKLTSLNVSEIPTLTNLIVYENQLSSIDVSKNLNLVSLNVRDNQLTSLDVSKNTNLKKLYASSNNLTSINLSKNTELTDLYLRYNQLNSLDLSKNTKLSTIAINENPYGKKLSPMFVGETDIPNENVVVLPGSLTPTVTYEVSEGVEIIDNKLKISKSGSHTYTLNSTNPVYNEAYTVEVVDINSDVYYIDKVKNYINVGGDNDEAVLNNIVVENGNAIIEDDYLIVRYGNIEVKRFKLIRIKSNVYNLSNDYIYVGNDSDEEIINNIEVNANMSINENVLRLEFANGFIKEYILVRVSSKYYNLDAPAIYDFNYNIINFIDVVNGTLDDGGDEILVIRDGKVVGRIKIANVKSDRYKLSNEYVFTGFEDIKLDEFSTGVNTKISYYRESFKVFYEDTELTNILICRLSNSMKDIIINEDTNRIFIESEMLYDNFINSISVNCQVPLSQVPMSIMVTDQYDEVVNDIKSGYKFKVIYSNGNSRRIVDEYNIMIKEDYVEYTNEENVEYTDNYGIDILKNLSFNDDFINVKKLIETDGLVNILDKDDKVLTEDSKIKTGDKFKISFNNFDYFINLSVLGDVTGRGIIDREDVNESYNILRKRKEVDKHYYLAGDINNDGKIKINDIAKLHQYVRGKITSIE